MRTEDFPAGLKTWLDMWHEGTAHKGDVAYALQQCLAETGESSYFQDSPAEIQEALLETFRRFKEFGVSEICIPQSGMHKDVSSQVLAAIEVLVEASLLGPDAKEITQRKQFFVGADYLANGEALLREIPADPGLLSAKVVGLSVPPSSPMGIPLTANLSIQFEVCRREAKDEGFYKLIPTRSWVANFEIRGSMSQVFRELAAYDYLASISIEPAKRGRRSGINLLLDDHVTQGRLFCESISLHSLEWLEIAHDG